MVSGPASPTAALAPQDAALDEVAGERILRQFAVFVACGYAGYLLLCAPTLAASITVMNWWWTIVSVVVVFVPGIALWPCGRWASIRQIRKCAAVAAVGYMTVVATWGFAWNGQYMPDSAGMWFSLFCGLAAIAGALAFPATIAFGILVAVTTSTVFVNQQVRPPDVNGPLIPDMAWAFAFSLVYFAAAVMGMRTAAILDTTRLLAYDTAAATAAATARANERRRFDLLTHDGVMATLLSAARLGSSAQLTRQARGVLDALDSLRAVADSDRAMSATAASEHISDTTGTADRSRAFRIQMRTGDLGPVSYPGDVVESIGAAAAEAVRNSHHHAAAAHPVDVALAMSPDGLTVTITDSGRGFDRASVPADRLGVSVSIEERMHRIGGTAVVDSAPGSGTRIILGWEHGESSAVSSNREDIRDLLGMRTRGAWGVIGSYLAAIVVVTAATVSGYAAPWPALLGSAIAIAATLALVLAPGDPLPGSLSVVLAVSGPLACALILSVTSPTTDTALQTFIHGAITTVLCFMNVRGRRVAPWISFAAMVGVFAGWAVLRGESVGEGVGLVAIDAAPLLMATLLSFTLRPTAQTVFALRADIASRIADDAAREAAAVERAAQLSRLDVLARPTLVPVAAGGPLTGPQREECALLEAHLRDRLRAPMLSTLRLDDAVYQARVRGVEVIVLDDSGGDPHPAVAAAVHDLATDALARAEEGRVCIRLWPPGRVAAASILSAGRRGMHLVEVTVESARVHLADNDTPEDQDTPVEPPFR